jgi:hypothetical protein
VDDKKAKFGRKSRDLFHPVGNEGCREYKQTGASLSSGSQDIQEGQYLNGLSKTHVVRQAGAEPKVAEPSWLSACYAHAVTILSQSQNQGECRPEETKPSHLNSWFI